MTQNSHGPGVIIRPTPPVLKFLSMPATCCNSVSSHQMLVASQIHPRTILGATSEPKVKPKTAYNLKKHARNRCQNEQQIESPEP